VRTADAPVARRTSVKTSPSVTAGPRWRPGRVALLRDALAEALAQVVRRKHAGRDRGVAEGGGDGLVVEVEIRSTRAEPRPISRSLGGSTPRTSAQPRSISAACSGGRRRTSSSGTASAASAWGASTGPGPAIVPGPLASLLVSAMAAFSHSASAQAGSLAFDLAGALALEPGTGPRRTMGHETWMPLQEPSSLHWGCNQVDTAAARARS
jgi:hypothetical protein